jgi:hypothetical protein
MVGNTQLRISLQNPSDQYWDSQMVSPTKQIESESAPKRQSAYLTNAPVDTTEHYGWYTYSLACMTNRRPPPTTGVVAAHRREYHFWYRCPSNRPHHHGFYSWRYSCWSLPCGRISITGWADRGPCDGVRFMGDSPRFRWHLNCFKSYPCNQTIGCLKALQEYPKRKALS